MPDLPEYEQSQLRGHLLSLKSSFGLISFLSNPKYLIGSVLVFAFFYLSVHFRGSINIVIFASILFTTTLAIMVAALYSVTMRMTHRNLLFHEDGWLYKILSRRTFAIFFWFFWGLITSYSLFIRMSFFTKNEWALFFVMFPCFWVTLYFVRLSIKGKVADLYQYRFILGSTSIIFPTCFAAIYAVTTLYGEPVSVPMTLTETINSTVSNFDADINSAFIKDSLFIFTAIQGPQQWILGNLPGVPSIAVWMLDVIAIWILAFNLSSILAILVLPSGELNRVFSSISESPTPRGINTSQIVYLSAVTTFFFFFIFLRGFIALEARAGGDPAYAAVRAQFSSLAKRAVEMIDGRRYEVGTVDKIERLRNGLLAENAALVAPLHDLTNSAFDQAEGKVDDFLDWYY
jgi:hypothetical protein